MTDRSHKFHDRTTSSDPNSSTNDDSEDTDYRRRSIATEYIRFSSLPHIYDSYENYSVLSVILGNVLTSGTSSHVTRITTITICQLILLVLTITLTKVRRSHNKLFVEYSELAWGAATILITIMLLLMIFKKMRILKPINFLILGIYSIALTFLETYVALKYDLEIVLISSGSISAFIILIIFVTHFSQLDITYYTSYFAVIFILSFMLTMSGLIYTFCFEKHTNFWGFHSYFCVFLFSMFLVYIMQQLHEGYYGCLPADEEILTIIAAMTTIGALLEWSWYLVQFTSHLSEIT